MNRRSFVGFLISALTWLQGLLPRWLQVRPAPPTYDGLLYWTSLGREQANQLHYRGLEQIPSLSGTEFQIAELIGTRETLYAFQKDFGDFPSYCTLKWRPQDGGGECLRVLGAKSTLVLDENKLVSTMLLVEPLHPTPRTFSSYGVKLAGEHSAKAGTVVQHKFSRWEDFQKPVVTDSEAPATPGQPGEIREHNGFRWVYAHDWVKCVTTGKST